jgi:pSer/pThr/pTyr-binding forkhead associated (FHA) protein
MHVRLVLVEPDAQPNDYRVELPATIGRGSDVQISLDHALVSRRHCELVEVEGKLVARDIGSRNGTFVAGKRVEEAPVPSGELLTIGAYTFRVIYRDGAAAPRSSKAVTETAWAVSTLADDETTVGSPKPSFPEPEERLEADGTDGFFKRM